MRMTTPTDAALRDPSAHPLVFDGFQGEQFVISVLEDDLIRVQHFPEGRPRVNRTWMVLGPDGDTPLEGRRRDDLSPFSLPEFALDVSEERVQVRTARLQVSLNPADFALRWADAEGQVFAADLFRRAYAYDRASRDVFHYMERREGEHYYGFGERSGPLDKHGRRMRMINLDSLGYNAEHGDPLYKHFPFYITFVPDLDIVYGLFYDNLALTTFDMGREIDHYYGPFRSYHAQDGDIDYHLLYGPTLEAVVEKFTALTGRMALPPRWSLGYLGSTMSYTDADNAQEQLKQFVDLCQQHDIPCDLFHLSSGYTSGPDGKRYVFNWNRDRIPDPPGMVEHFHAAGIRLSANIKPCLLTTHPRYDELAGQGLFVQQANADKPEINIYWGGDGSHLDFTNPAAYNWWKNGVKTALLEYGIDSTWNDNNEYEIWDDEVRCHGFGQQVRLGPYRTLHTLLMVRASYEAQREFAPDQRPFVLTRSACPGMQRYAQTWSGDNYTSWNTLRYNIPMGLGLGLSGMPNTGHDVGGFAGPRPEPELFVRWVQNGIFHPRFCIHSWNTYGTVNEPWMYPDMLPLVRDAIAYRYRLIPYLYSLFWEAAHTGHPIIRPMVYGFPYDPRCRTESFDFMLGPNLLVASVIEPGARTRDVYLPQGVRWCDWHSGAWYDGGQTVTLDAPLERVPRLAPAGGIVPLGKVMQHVGAEPDSTRHVYVFPQPDGGHGAFLLVEDDGTSMGYQRGAYTALRLAVEAASDAITLDVTPEHMGYDLPYDSLTFVLPPGEPRPVQGADVQSEALGPDGRRHVVVALPFAR
jgi:alpha-glucosidase